MHHAGLAICSVLIPVLTGAALGQRLSPLEQEVDARAAEAIAGIAESGIATDTGSLDRLADAVALTATDRESGALVSAEAAVRVLSLCESLTPDEAKRIANLATDHPDLVRRLVFELDADHDMAPSAARVLLGLIDSASEARVAEYQNLAVAVAVVHDEPVQRSINENEVEAEDPGQIFAYLSSNASSLQINPTRLPTDLLVFVVSATEGVDQLDWARRSYRRDANHGQRFFEIQYDVEHYRSGQTKAVTLADRYCLEAIKHHGGVCADQAYFAEQVAKANGVPSAYMRGRSGEVSHAWLGYLRSSRSGVRWDFDAGRYDAYKGVRGETINPQTNEPITDGELSMRASDYRLTDAQRWEAAALASAAARIAGYDPEQADALVQEHFEGRTAARSRSTDDRVKLLEQSVERRPGDPEAWRAFAEIASAGGVEPRTIDRWLSAFERSSGRSSPDMLTDLVEMLLVAVPETGQKIDVLEWVMPKLRGRSDLQAWVRLEQGRVFEEADDLENAWRAYDDVTKRFLNEGPFAVTAVDHMLDMLDRTGKPAPAFDLLGRVFQQADRPFSTGSFRTQSNWFQLGMRYLGRLSDAGRTGEAEALRTQLLGG